MGSPDRLTFSELLIEHKKLVYLAPLAYVVGVAFEELRKALQAEPWHVALLLLPGIIVMLVEWKRLEDDFRAFVSVRFLVLVMAYVLMFSIAANSRLLSWKSRITGFESGLQTSFLALNRLGDWHYWFVREKVAPGDLLVVLLEPSNPTLTRQLSSELIQAAQVHGAVAVALDFDFSDPRPEADEQFCLAVESAKKRKRRGPMPVLYGLRHRNLGGSTSIEEARSLPCLRSEDGGHLLGVMEWDGTVRSVPINYDRNQRWQALSAKIAAVLKPELEIPKSTLIQFVEPAQGVDVRSHRDVKAEPGLLADKVVLVGFDQADFHRTPFGELPGVVIHAYAAQSLRSGQLIRRPSPWTSFPVVFLTCYLVLLLFLADPRRVRPVTAAAAMSVLIVLVAVGAMWWRLLWLDVSYPIAAMWLFLGLLNVTRALNSWWPTSAAK